MSIEEPTADGIEVQAIQALVRVSRILERASDHLTLAQYRVLSAIASGDQRASRVAARLALGRPTVSATVEALALRGLLDRSTEDRDHRAEVLGVTEQGRAALALAESNMRARLGELSTYVADPEGVLRHLVELGDSVERVQSERHAGDSR